MSDILYRDRKSRRVKKVAIEVQKLSLKNKGRTNSMRGVKSGK